MRHYPHHIGDFNSATRHLTRVERSLYRDLIDLYYDTEQPLNGDFDKLARRVICDEDDKPSMRTVLNEFFVQQDDGWHNARCDAEIAKYQEQIDQASRAGKASAAKRYNKDSTTVQRPLDSRCTNQNQNQEPITIKQPSVVKRAAKKCPADFEVTPEMIDWAAMDCPGVNVERATAKFRDHSFDKPKTDWFGTWKNWIRRDFDSMAAQSKLPAWREQQRSETMKAVPSIALGGVNPTTFFENLGAQNVAIARLR